jgi:hypothetical protein
VYVWEISYKVTTTDTPRVRGVFRKTRVVVRSLDSLLDKVIMIDRSDSVEHFKARVAGKFLIPIDAQKLVLRTTELMHGNLLRACENEQEEILLHVRDLRIHQLFISTPNGRHALLEYVPSLPVEILKHRIKTIEYLEMLPVGQMRLTYAGREMCDDSRRLSEYNVESECTVQLTIRIAGGSEPEEEDDDNMSHEDYYDGDTDDTCSMDSVPTCSDGGMFDHRGVRVLRRFDEYVAISPWEEDEAEVPSSQATTLRYVLSPDDDGEAPDPNQSGCVGSGAEPESGPEGEGEADVPDQSGCVGTSAEPDLDGEGQPDGEGETDVPDQSGCVGTSVEPEPEGGAAGRKRQRTSQHTPGGFQIFIRSPYASWVVLWVEATDSIADVKRKLLDKLGYVFAGPEDIRLVTGIRDLLDERTLQDYNIGAGDNLWMIKRLRGGAGGGGMDDSEGDAMQDLSQQIPDQVVRLGRGQLAPPPHLPFKMN